MRIGFDVPKWESKAFREFTNEELLEYWYKLRLMTKSGEVDTSDTSRKGLNTDMYIIELQEEIIRRMDK
jgi:hypothetical protein